MRERRTHGSVRGLRREPLVYSTAELEKSEFNGVFMKYLPIFQELFESDSIVFMLIGLILAVFIGIKMNDTRQIIISVVSSFALYVVCELISNIHTNFMFEIILLFVGTIALGGIIGFLISTLVLKVRKQ